MPITTVIALTFSRPPPIVELKLDPEVKVASVRQEIVAVASGRFTFHLAEPLKPATNYAVTVTFGQKEPLPGYAPAVTVSWQFTTAP